MSATLLAAFGAGMLSVLSPCVLPLLPILAATAAAEGRAARRLVSPLLILGALPDRFLGRARGWMGKVGWGAGPILGGGLVLVGSLVVTGIDKRIETWLVDAAPDWLTRLSIAL
jgi:thiol:disulfide interchange protein